MRIAILHAVLNSAASFVPLWMQNQIGSAENQGLVDRIEVEYNNFFLRAVKSIFYADANAGMWQYLASVPYSTIKEEILWHAYAIYHFSGT